MKAITKRKGNFKKIKTGWGLFRYEPPWFISIFQFATERTAREDRWSEKWRNISEININTAFILFSVEFKRENLEILRILRYFCTFRIVLQCSRNKTFFGALVVILSLNLFKRSKTIRYVLRYLYDMNGQFCFLPTFRSSIKPTSGHFNDNMAGTIIYFIHTKFIKHPWIKPVITNIIYTCKNSVIFIICFHLIVNKF